MLAAAFDLEARVLDGRVCGVEVRGDDGNVSLPGTIGPSVGSRWIWVPPLSGVSVFGGVGERTREGNDLWHEFQESGVIDRQRSDASRARRWSTDR